jgi:hypothetical protein
MAEPLVFVRWRSLFLCLLISCIPLDRVLYTPERLAKIADEAAKKDGSAFGLNDRLGLVYDALALSKAGFAEVSSALTMVEKLKNETECVYATLQGAYFF